MTGVLQGTQEHWEPCAGDSPFTGSCLFATAFAGNLLCPRQLTLDKPFCSVGDHGEEERGRFQMKLIILMSVR